MSFRDRLRSLVGVANTTPGMPPAFVEELRDLLIRSERNDLIVNPDVPFQEAPAAPAPLPGAEPTPDPEQVELARRQALVARIGEKYGFPVDGQWSEAFYQKRIDDSILIAEQTRRNGGRAVSLD